MRLTNMLRRRIVAGMVVFAGLCLAPSPQLSAQTRISPILQGIETRYNAVKTLQVDFTQVFRFGPRSRTESGTLFLQKPGKMRWEYGDPEGKLFLSDGKFVYLYSPSTNVVERTPFRATDDLRAPLAFLLGKLDFQRDFGRFTLKPEADNYWITAEPKNERSPYTMVSFLVSPSFEILEVEVSGMDQAVNRFRFHNELRNPSLTESRFEFRPPQGARLVEAEQ
ncbi:MAG: outer membrane lipoprotein carrier protein LolA [Bryobacterales bacterium]|nr:outer membrane lipoprotein carrier protein LolA [Bryobacterales bacterium]